jgi:hypothetical protein
MPFFFFIQLKISLFLRKPLYSIGFSKFPSVKNLKEGKTSIEYFIAKSLYYTQSTFASTTFIYSYYNNKIVFLYSYNSF